MKRYGAERFECCSKSFFGNALLRVTVEEGLNRAIKGPSVIARDPTFTHQAFVLCVVLLGLRGDCSSTAKLIQRHNSVGCLLSRNLRVSSSKELNQEIRL